MLIYFYLHRWPSHFFHWAICYNTLFSCWFSISVEISWLKNPLCDLIITVILTLVIKKKVRRVLFGSIKCDSRCCLKEIIKWRSDNMCEGIFLRVFVNFWFLNAAFRLGKNSSVFVKIILTAICWVNCQDMFSTGGCINLLQLPL